MARPCSSALAVSRGTALLQIGHCGRTFSLRIGLNVLRPLWKWRRIRFTTSGKSCIALVTSLWERKSLRKSFYEIRFCLKQLILRTSPHTVLFGAVPSSRERGSGILICGLGIADDVRVFLDEEGHPGSDFFLIISYYCLQQGDEFFDFVGVLFAEDVSTELPHKAGVVHEAAPPLEHRLFDF